MKHRHVLLAWNWYHPKLHRGIAQVAKTHGWHLNTDMALHQNDIPWGWEGDGVITQPMAASSQLHAFIAQFPGKIVAFHARGDNSLTLTITYNNKEISLFAVGSARGGGLPMRWIDNLKKDINVFLIRKVATKG